MKKVIIILLFLFLGLGGYFYTQVFVSGAEETVQVDFRDGGNVAEKILEAGVINSPKLFNALAEYKGLERYANPGIYTINKGMSMNAIINMFIAGNQAPVNLIFNNIRLPKELAGVIAGQLKLDSASIIHELIKGDQVDLSELGTSIDPFLTFLPDTYEVYWGISMSELQEKMAAYYVQFWTKERQEKAKSIGLSPDEVSILASIVEEETNVASEMPTVAGLYLNRLERGIKLEADPTVRYAWGDFTIKRVLYKHLEIDSPYNTYKRKGLPPGPIRLPSKQGIDAVLNHDKHEYIFMCANPDFSGTHLFAKTLSQHRRNARGYQKVLDEKGIR